MSNKTKVKVVVILSLILVFGVILLSIVFFNSSIKKPSEIVADDKFEDIEDESDYSIGINTSNSYINDSDSSSIINSPYIGEEKVSPDKTKKAWIEVIFSSKGGPFAEKKELIVEYIQGKEIEKFEIPDQQDTVGHMDFLWFDNGSIIVNSMAYDSESTREHSRTNFYRINLNELSIEPFDKIKTTQTRNRYLFFGDFNPSRTAFYTTDSICVDCAPSLAMVRIFDSQFKELNEDLDCWGTNYYGCDDYKWIDNNTLEYKIYIPTTSDDMDSDSRSIKFEIRYLKI